MRLNELNKITIGLLLLALLPLPYSYYMFLRWAVLISSSIHFYFALRKKRIFALIIFTALGLLFNPFAPVHLSAAAWMILDLLSALFMAIGLKELDKTTAP